VSAKLRGDTSMYAVFDGHNGPAAAQFCASRLGSLIGQSKFDLQREPCRALEEAFKQADEELLRGTTEMAGTTALVMLAHGDEVAVASVGDSRAVLLKKDGSVCALSVEHKPDRLDERERIARAGGTVEHWGVWRVEGLLAMSRAIGDRRLKKFVIPDPDCTRTKINPAEDAFVVLATDGLFDVMRNDEVARVCRGCTSSDAAATKLAEEVVNRGIVDNTTVLVVQVGNSL
jgi:protein phosphatase 1L